MSPAFTPTTPDAYDLVAGERRMRASEIAQKKTIPAVIREMTDAEVREFRQIELSVVRKSFLGLHAARHVVYM